jgi:hypothetical protein
MGVNAAMKWAQIAKLTSALSQIAQSNADSFFKKEGEQAQARTQQPFPIPFPPTFPSLPSAAAPFFAPGNMLPPAAGQQSALSPSPTTDSFAAKQSPPHPVINAPHQHPVPLQPSVPSTATVVSSANSVQQVQSHNMPSEHSSNNGGKGIILGNVIQPKRESKAATQEEKDAAQALSGIANTLNILRQNHAKALEEVKLRQDMARKAADRKQWIAPTMDTKRASQIPHLRPQEASSKRRDSVTITTSNGAVETKRQKIASEVPSKRERKNRAPEILKNTEEAASIQMEKGSKDSTKTPTVVSNNTSDTSGDSENSSFSSKRKDFGLNGCNGTPAPEEGDIADSVSSSFDNFRPPTQGVAAANEGSEMNSKEDPSSDLSEGSQVSDDSVKNSETMEVQTVSSGQQNSTKKKRRKKSKVSSFTSQNVADHTSRMNAMQSRDKRRVWQ